MPEELEVLVFISYLNWRAVFQDPLLWNISGYLWKLQRYPESLNLKSGQLGRLRQDVQTFLKSRPLLKGPVPLTWLPGRASVLLGGNRLGHVCLSFPVDQMVVWALGSQTLLGNHPPACMQQATGAKVSIQEHGVGFRPSQLWARFCCGAHTIGNGGKQQRCHRTPHHTWNKQTVVCFASRRERGHMKAKTEADVTI